MKNKLIKPATSISCGITWVDGRVIFRSTSDWALAYFGICHYSNFVWMLTPIDYLQPTMITTIEVSPEIQYCDHSDVCLHFKCLFNKFNKSAFVDMFKDCGASSLDLPQSIGIDPIWFNEPPYDKFWEKLIIPISGGTLRVDETKI